MSLENGVPPYTNRGAQNTSQSGLVPCLDWLQVTFKDVRNPYDIIDLLDLDYSLFSESLTGKYGYAFGLRFGHISIYYSDEIPTVHLEFTGQGCREYESMNRHTWDILLSHILMLRVNITRLDLAIDDYKGYFTVKNLIRKLDKEIPEATSKFKSWREMRRQKLSNNENLGHTLYLGSPQSKLMIRFYDKLAERKSKGFEIQDGVTFWNRTELQLRDERAETAAIYIAENKPIGKIVLGILANYITFRSPNKNETNKSRWKVSPFWQKFLDDVEPLALTQKAPDKTIQSTKSWFEHQILSSFSLLLEAYDYNFDLLLNWFENGLERRSTRHEKMLEEFLKEKSLKNEILQPKRDEIKERLLAPRSIKTKDEFIQKIKTLKKEINQNID